jgi:indolepyruvate ferredoxin oxidoreductase alpha subunit
LEENVKILSAELASQIGAKTFFGKKDGSIPTVGEMNPDLVIAALCKILKIENNGVPEIYTNRAQELFSAGAPHRDMTFCAGCPHRASFWSIHNIENPAFDGLRNGDRQWVWKIRRLRL